MLLDADSVNRKGKVFFKSSVEEIIGQQKVSAIKNILDIVDLVVEPDTVDSKTRKRIRKAVLDNVNDLYRVATSMIESLAGNDDGRFHKTNSKVPSGQETV